MNETILQVVLIAFGAGTLAGLIVFVISWGLVSALNIFKKI